ncbi:hypothetical protein AAF712_004453 [Marasmius tenuissimus]|uniref:Uncharacterized protein n=1 Tax=Marasmius tenuissimus TaxID=585030 RepID=A0ABR3A4E4_9AGAR
MAMVVAGYVGYFNMVSRTEVPNGPCVWFGMETGLAVLRIALWGWNPSWDEGDTGMTMHLALRSRDLTSHTPPVLSESEPATSEDKAGPLQLALTSAISHFPLITTSQPLTRLTSHIQHGDYWLKDNKEFFIVESVDDFLAAATPYVGPLPRLDAEGLEGILLYYGIVPDLNETSERERKLLCMTICRSDSKWTSISVFIDGDMSRTMFTSQSQDFPGTRALRVALDTEVKLDSIAVIDRRTFDLLVDYSFRLFSRLCTVDTKLEQSACSIVEYDPSLLSSPRNYSKVDPVNKNRQGRGALLVGVFQTSEAREWGLILESAVMEVYLCILERRFLQPISPSPTHFRPLALEWVRGMEDRISLDKESCRRRWSDPTQVHVLFSYEATYDILVRELRSLRQASTDSIAIRTWEEAIALIMDHPDQLPVVLDLFGLSPLHNLEKLRKALLPLFTETDAYQKMITYLRSSLFRLRDVKVPSDLYTRIDPYGPDSPNSVPIHTAITANRQKWQEQAWRGGEFTYGVGLDLNRTNPGDYMPVSVYQGDILLTDRAEVFAMVYLPRPGKIVLNLSLKPHRCDIMLVAVLTRSGSVGEAWELKMSFIAKSTGEELGKELSGSTKVAEGSMIAKEGKEANRGGTCSLETSQLGGAVYLGFEPDTNLAETRHTQRKSSRPGVGDAGDTEENT